MATATETIIKPNMNLKEPSQYNVIYMNDEITTMEFVVRSLVEVFGYTPETAMTLTLQVHEEGSAIVATLPHEVAEQKGAEVTLMARNNGFPLEVKLQQV